MGIKTVYLILKWFFGLLVVATGVGKLLDNRGFADVILTYQFGLPHPVAMVMGLAVSLFELVLGLSLLSTSVKGTQQRNGLLLILMHAGYVVLATISNLRGLNLINCGCFGVFWGRSLTWATVVEDVVLLSFSVLFYFLVKKQIFKKEVTNL